jgi:hypothetical protein
MALEGVLTGVPPVHFFEHRIRHGLNPQFHQADRKGFNQCQPVPGHGIGPGGKPDAMNRPAVQKRPDAFHQRQNLPGCQAQKVAAEKRHLHPGPARCLPQVPADDLSDPGKASGKTDDSPVMAFWSQKAH